jgi:hypothetical protein
VKPTDGDVVAVGERFAVHPSPIHVRAVQGTDVVHDDRAFRDANLGMAGRNRRIVELEVRLERATHHKREPIDQGYATDLAALIEHNELGDHGGNVGPGSPDVRAAGRRRAGKASNRNGRRVVRLALPEKADATVDAIARVVSVLSAANGAKHVTLRFP